MHHKVHRLHGAFFKFRTLFSEELVALLLVLFVIVVPAGATTRFEHRSLTMYNSEPGATTTYKVALQYMTPEPVGSLDLQFCVSPIPHDPCVTPPGLDISNTALTHQTGETGFTKTQVSENHIILTRPPQMIAAAGSTASYEFNNIVNPTDQTDSFSIRLRSHQSTDATGPHIDFGSVKGQVGAGVVIETQVPPMLIFCVAQEVQEDCLETNGNYFTDMGNLSEKETLTAQSQLAVGTNASAGFAVTVNGNPLTAGTNVIDGMTTTDNSKMGQNQFGINLVENDELSVGHNPEGVWSNAFPSADYSQPNKYKYREGDVVAYSDSVTLIKKFTVSYIVNVNPNLRAGVYTATINFIASGRF